MSASYPVRSQYRANTPQQLLGEPVSVLLTVSVEAEKILNDLGISSIFDLGASHLFGTARHIVSVADPDTDDIVDKIAADVLDSGSRSKTASELAESNITVLRQIDDTTAQNFASILGVKTVREMAAWPAYSTARLIINDAYGLSPSITGDIERPDDLIPVSRRYATERLQYDVIVMDKVLKRRKGLAEGAVQGVFDLLDVGGIDVGDVDRSASHASPALGAVLTYRQSWFPQGLALGHLLHSMALAPGESTRIAMVDWSRSVRASTTEETTQSESLLAELTRNRALSEITAAVAREAQSGFSESASKATATQSAVTAGTSGVSLEAPGLLNTIGSAIFGGDIGGVNTTSIGASNATANNSGWASSKSSSAGSRSLNASMMQNVSDRTQQAANSTRNRRATAVVETNQKETENLSTRVVTNYNHMHALTIQYFEVVQVYRVVLELARVTPCLFIPMKPLTFNAANAARFRFPIASVGLRPEVRSLRRPIINTLAVTAPFRDKLWTNANELSAQLKDYIGEPDWQEILLPVNGIKILLDGRFLNDQQFSDNFEEMVVYLRDGRIYREPLPRNVVEPGGITGSGVIPPSYLGEEIDRITLKRRPGKEKYTGLVGVSLPFDFQGNDYTLGTVINIPSDEAEVIIFVFEPSIVNPSLIRHLNENSLYYSSAIWRSLDIGHMTALLSSYMLNGQSLIDNVDPIPVSVSGNYIVFRYYGGTDTAEWNDFLRLHELEDSAPLEDLVPLPSGGVFAEAVLGRSNAAEKLDITRFWNWQDSPIPILPPEINPLTAGGKANDSIPSTSNLESPIVNIVNPPSLPDPTGLASLYTAISNGNMFRDMSAMAQTSALVQAALQSAQASAASSTGAATSAQQVAAKQLTDLLQMAAQVALSAATGGAGGTAGAAAGVLGALTGGNNPGIAKTPTNAGALINHGRSLDSRNVGEAIASPGTLRGSATSQSTGSLTTGPSGSGNRGGSQAGTKSLDERSAFQGAVGGGGGGGVGGVLGEVLSLAMGATPTTEKAPLSVPGIRWCCQFGYNSAIEPADVRDHRYNNTTFNDNVGFVYTERAGIIDIGHVRDLVDLTKYIYDAFLAGQEKIECRDGTATLNATPRDPILLAQAIAYVDAWSHELVTFGQLHQDFSSFSPEDLPSNFLGAYIGGHAIALSGSNTNSFNSTVDTLLSGLLAELVAHSAADTNTVIESVKGRWWDTSLGVPKALRRNFDSRPWFPKSEHDKPPAPSFIDASGLYSVFTDFEYSSKPLADGSGSIKHLDFFKKTEELRAAFKAAGTDVP